MGAAWERALSPNEHRRQSVPSCQSAGPGAMLFVGPGEVVVERAGEPIPDGSLDVCVLWRTGTLVLEE
jgi:hypothetical protein